MAALLFTTALRAKWGVSQYLALWLGWTPFGSSPWPPSLYKCDVWDRKTEDGGEFSASHKTIWEYDCPHTSCQSLRGALKVPAVMWRYSPFSESRTLFFPWEKKSSQQVPACFPWLWSLSKSDRYLKDLGLQLTKIAKLSHSPRLGVRCSWGVGNLGKAI